MGATPLRMSRSRARLLRQNAIKSLDAVLTAGTDTLLCKFATSLMRDNDAINAALSLPWTTSPVEAQILRIKMIKRTMYGRASFELLRALVLHPGQRQPARKVWENQCCSGIERGPSCAGGEVQKIVLPSSIEDGKCPQWRKWAHVIGQSVGIDIGPGR